MAIVSNLSSEFGYRSKQVLDAYVEFDNHVKIACSGTRTRQKVAGWRQIIKDGGDATGPYSLDATTIRALKPATFSQSTTGLVYNPSNVTNTEVYTGLPYTVHLPQVIPTSGPKADSIALSKLYRKIKSEQEQLNSLASLAEIADVIRQFGSPAAALVDLTNKRLNRLELERRGLKGTVVFKRAQWHRIVASTWLEYSFGLAPLIADTENVAKALARFNFEDQLVKKKKTSARGEDEARQVTTQTNASIGSGNIRYRVSTEDTSTSRCQYIVGLSATRTADFGSNERLLELLGLNSANLIPAAWEAVPWSWLIDYFSNVGNILEACATSTASVTWMCKTTSSKHVRKKTGTIDDNSSNNRVAALSRKTVSRSGGQASYEAVRTILSRTKPTSLGCPALYLELPTRNKQLANMVAVLFARREKSSALWLF